MSHETDVPHPANTGIDPDLQTGIEHQEDRARFELDANALFGTDLELAGAIKNLHATDAQVTGLKAAKATDPAQRAELEAAMRESHLRAREMTVEQSGALTPEQQAKVAHYRTEARQVIIDTAVNGDTEWLTERYGQERGEKHASFYRDLARQAIKEAKPFNQ